MSRRELALTVAAPAAWQTPPAPSTPAAELEAARKALREAAGIMDQFSLPPATEPACVFKA